MGEDICVDSLYIVRAPRDKVLDRDVKWNGDTKLPTMEGTGGSHEDCPRTFLAGGSQPYKIWSAHTINVLARQHLIVTVSIYQVYRRAEQLRQRSVIEDVGFFPLRNDLAVIK